MQDGDVPVPTRDAGAQGGKGRKKSAPHAVWGDIGGKNGRVTGALPGTFSSAFVREAAVDCGWGKGGEGIKENITSEMNVEFCRTWGGGGESTLSPAR